MKVCIVTVFHEMNYGAYLQAYALGRRLERDGHDVWYYEKTPWSVMDYVHALHLREIRNLGFNIRLLKGYAKAWRLLKRTGDLDGFDVVVIGSDELWNVRNVNFRHDGYYVGKGMSAPRRITYAVSCNTCSAEEVLRQYPDLDGFSELDDISVRDAKTADLVRTLSDRVPVNVLDPTFLVDYKVPKPKEKGRYVLIYGYYFTDEEIRRIGEYLRRYDDITVISVGFPHSWCDKCVACGPFEFMGYVKGAHEVITSTFHGTVFSIIFRKNFLSFARNNAKTLDVLHKFGLDGQNVSDADVAHMDANVAYDRGPEDRIREWRAASDAFLDRHFGTDGDKD